MTKTKFSRDLKIRILKSQNLLYQPLGEQAVILNMNNEQYYGLDERGVRLWQLLDEYAEPAKLIPQILAEYEVEEDVLQHDLAVFIADLQQADLIRVEPL